MKSWMVELAVGGRGDLDLVIPELAEVVVETVNARTGERLPLEKILYGFQEDLPGQVNQQWLRADLEDEPGLSRFWTAPGAAFVKTLGIPSGLDYGGLQREDFERVPGL